MTAATKDFCVASSKELARMASNLLARREITFQSMLLSAGHIEDVMKMNNPTNSAIRNSVPDISVAARKLGEAAKAKLQQEASDAKAAIALQREQESATAPAQAIVLLNAAADRQNMLGGGRSRKDLTMAFGDPSTDELQLDLQNFQPANGASVSPNLAVAAAAGSSARGMNLWTP